MALFREPERHFAPLKRKSLKRRPFILWALCRWNPAGASQPQAPKSAVCRHFRISAAQSDNRGMPDGSRSARDAGPGHCSVGSPLLKQEVPPADHDGCGSQVAIRLSQGFRASGAANEQPERFPGSVSDNLPPLIMKGRWRARKKASESGRFWPLLAGFSKVAIIEFILVAGDVAGRKKVSRQGLIRSDLTAFQPSSGPANRHVRPLFRLPHKPTSVESPGFGDCADSLARRRVRFEKKLAHVAGFVPAHAASSDSRPPAPRSRGRTSTASSCRPICAICSSEVAHGVTGGSGLGSAVLGSRDLVRIVARSRETGTLGSTLEFEPQIS